MCEGLLVFCQASLVPWPYHPLLPPTKALHLFFQSASLPSSSSSPSPSSSSLWSDPWVQSCAGLVLLGEPVPLPGFTAALGHHTEDSIKPKVVQMVLLQINVQIRTYVHTGIGHLAWFPFVCASFNTFFSSFKGWQNCQSCLSCTNSRWGCHGNMYHSGSCLLQSADICTYVKVHSAPVIVMWLSCDYVPAADTSGGSHVGRRCCHAFVGLLPVWLSR